MRTLLLLLGLFVAPAAALWLGQGIRRRGERVKGLFFWGVGGYGVGLVAWLAVLLWPAVEWAPEGLRGALVYGALPAGALLGGLVGALLSWDRPGDADGAG